MPDRRAFLETGALAAAWYALSPQRLAAGPARRQPALVMLLQRGANDGLNSVVPFGDPGYRELRPGLAIAPPSKGNPDAALDLDGFFGLHPALAPLLPLWREGTLAAVHAVGSPDGGRSHFDAQDYVETGTPGVKSTRDGWMSRALAAESGAGSPLRAVSLTPTLPRALAGAPHAVAIQDPAGFGLRRRAAALAPGFEAMYAGDDLLGRSGRDAFDAVAFLEDRLRGVKPTSARYPGGPDAAPLASLARLIKADVGLEMAFCEMGGWDHHANQGGARGQHANRLRVLAGGLAAFASDLGDRKGEVRLLVLTEFGRTARQNGNGGTDHGHGSTAFALGGGVRGGRVLGKWPGLAREQLFEGRDLAVTTDFRDLALELLAGRPAAAAPDRVFPGLPPAAPPGLLGA